MWICQILLIIRMSTIVINVSIKFQITFWAHFTNFKYLLMYSRIYWKTFKKPLKKQTNPKNKNLEPVLFEALMDLIPDPFESVHILNSHLVGYNRLDKFSECRLAIGCYLGWWWRHHFRGPFLIMTHWLISSQKIIGSYTITWRRKNTVENTFRELLA